MSEEKTLMNTTGELAYRVSELSIMFSQKDPMGDSDQWIEIPRLLFAHAIKAVANELTEDEVRLIIAVLNEGVIE